jgi:hypothetical protein
MNERMLEKGVFPCKGVTFAHKFIYSRDRNGVSWFIMHKFLVREVSFLDGSSHLEMHSFCDVYNVQLKGN